MTKKRAIIIAIVIFLLIGLSIFTFANGKNKDDKLEDKDDKTKVEIKKDEEKDDEEEEEEYVSKYIAPVDTKSYVKKAEAKTSGKKASSSNSGNNGNNAASNEETDDSYEKALAAVVQSENDLTEDSYEAAKDLVDKVKDDKKKEELADRLEEVKNIIDATKIIEKLEADLADAKSKDDIATIVDERENSDIDNLIDTITDETKKNELSERLAAIDKVIYDTTAPVATFKDEQDSEVVVADEDIIGKKISVAVTDENEFTVVMTKDGEEVEYTDGMELEDGVYTVVITDKAFNETSVSFTVDTTAPVFVNSSNGNTIVSPAFSKKALNVKIDDLTFEKAEIKKTVKEEKNGGWLSGITVSNKTTTETKTENEFVLAEEGVYEITAYDKTGKSTTISLSIDVAPVVEIKETKQTSFGNTYVTKVEINVSDQFLKTVKVTGKNENGQNKVKDNRITWSNSYTYSYLLPFHIYEGEYTIEVTDVHGNVVTKTFTLGKVNANTTNNTNSATQSTSEVKESTTSVEVYEDSTEVEEPVEEVVEKEETIVDSEEVQTTETEEAKEEPGESEEVAEEPKKETVDSEEVAEEPKKVEEVTKKEETTIEAVTPEEKVEEEKPIEE